jgi:hypothetical protein
MSLLFINSFIDGKCKRFQILPKVKNMTYKFLKRLIGLHTQSDINEQTVSYMKLIDIAFSLIDAQEDPFDYVLDNGEFVFLSGRGVEVIANENAIVISENLKSMYTKLIPPSKDCSTVWKIFSSFKNSKLHTFIHTNHDISGYKTQMNYLKNQLKISKQEVIQLKLDNKNKAYKIMELEAKMVEYKQKYESIQKNGVTEENVSELKHWKTLFNNAKNSLTFHSDTTYV